MVGPAVACSAGRWAAPRALRMVALWAVSWADGWVGSSVASKVGTSASYLEHPKALKERTIT